MAQYLYIMSYMLAKACLLSTSLKEPSDAKTLPAAGSGCVIRVPRSLEHSTVHQQLASSYIKHKEVIGNIKGSFD